MGLSVLNQSLLLWVVHAAIGITVLEVLWLLRRRACWDIAANVVAGLCLMLALRTALVEGAGWAVLLWLTLSGVAHLAYLRSALRDPSRAAQKAQRQPE